MALAGAGKGPRRVADGQARGGIAAGPHGCRRAAVQGGVRASRSASVLVQISITSLAAAGGLPDEYAGVSGVNAVYRPAERGLGSAGCDVAGLHQRLAGAGQNLRDASEGGVAGIGDRQQGVDVVDGGGVGVAGWGAGRAA